MNSQCLRGWGWLVVTASGCALSSEAPGTPEKTEGAVAIAAAATNLPASIRQALASSSISAHSPFLDTVYTVEHVIPLAPDRWIHATESLTLRAVLRWPHRAMVMLPGPLTRGDFFNIPVDGYEGREMMAKRGFFAFTVDFEGTGASSYPVDGRQPDLSSEVPAIVQVVEHVRETRLVPKVDMLGESWAGGVAAEVCGKRHLVRSCTLGSMIYKTPSDLANQTFRSSNFKAMLDSLPDGYLPTDSEFYRQSIASDSPPAVQDWMAANEPGRYATAPLYSVFDLPFFDVSAPRVPGLIIQGAKDPNQPIEDAQQLAADYDRRAAQLVVIDGGHIPRVEPSPNNELYWKAVIDFVDP